MALLACVGLMAGCIDRRFVVSSDPATAIVYVNGRPIGASPADDHFVYYGNYHFTLVKDGYQTLQVDQYIASPWYEYPVIDFITENLVPFKIRDVRRLNYAMIPLQVPNTKQLQEEAQVLRGRGQAIPTPVPEDDAPPPVPVPVASALPTR
jgi:hypothetical protein